MIKATPIVRVCRDNRAVIPLVIPGLHLARRPYQLQQTTNGNSTGLKTTEDQPVIIPKHPIIIPTLTYKNKGSVKADNNCTVFS